MADTVKGDRRASHRSSALSDAGLHRARVRTGRVACVINLSISGALIETEWRLLPGSRVDLQIGEPHPIFRVSGRIVRCHVALLERARVRYRGALVFDAPLPIGEFATRNGDSVR